MNRTQAEGIADALALPAALELAQRRRRRAETLQRMAWNQKFYRCALLGGVFGALLVNFLGPYVLPPRLLGEHFVRSLYAGATAGALAGLVMGALVLLVNRAKSRQPLPTDLDPSADASASPPGP